MKEQRKFTRHNVQHLLDFTTTDNKGKKTSFHMGRILDLSRGGMKIETPINLNIASRIEITAGIEDNLIDLTGKVAHSHEADKGFISGIQILSISPENRSIITSYIEKVRKSENIERLSMVAH